MDWSGFGFRYMQSRFTRGNFVARRVFLVCGVVLGKLDSWNALFG